MKIIEEEYLKESIKKLNTFAEEHSDFLDFFNVCDVLTKESLQSQSFEGDLKFFDEVSFVLSVITSIISKPIISSTREEVILRSAMAPALTNEMFQETLRDSTLWRNDGFGMVPEYVHYHQHIDELKIYENIFIIYLVNMLDLEIKKYNEFYLSMVQIYDAKDSLTLLDDYISKGMKKLSFINRKMKLIKGSRFYKLIIRDALKMGIVHPTNILTKNRLYNLCYKFYKKMINYVDETEKIIDFRNYYCIRIFKALKQLGFETTSNESIYKNKKFDFKELEFVKDHMSLKLYPEIENNGLVLEVLNNKVEGLYKNSSKNLLLFDSSMKFDDVEALGKDLYDSVELISLWNLAFAYDVITSVFDKYKTEEEIITYWIESKLQTVTCNIDIYSKYCPSCKSTEIVEKKDSLFCETCMSKYVFYNLNEVNQKLWFVRYRNKKTSK